MTTSPLSLSASAEPSSLPGSNGTGTSTGALHLALAAAVTGLLGVGAQAEGLKPSAATRYSQPLMP